MSKKRYSILKYNSVIKMKIILLVTFCLISNLIYSKELSCVLFSQNNDSINCKLKTNIWNVNILNDEYLISKNKIEFIFENGNIEKINVNEIKKLKIIIGGNDQTYETKPFKNDFRLMKSHVKGSANLYEHIEYNPWNQYNMYVSYYYFEGNNKQSVLSIHDIWNKVKKEMILFFDNCPLVTDMIKNKEIKIIRPGIIYAFETFNNSCKN